MNDYVHHAGPCGTLPPPAGVGTFPEPNEPRPTVMMPARTRATAAVVGIAAAVGLMLADMMPAHAATLPAHHDTSPLVVNFVQDQPGPGRTCLVQAMVIGAPSSAIRFTEVTPRARVAGRTVLDIKGRTHLPLLTVRPGGRVRASAATHGQRPVVTVERASC